MSVKIQKVEITTVFFKNNFDQLFFGRTVLHNAGHKIGIYFNSVLNNCHARGFRENAVFNVENFSQLWVEKEVRSAEVPTVKN